MEGKPKQAFKKSHTLRNLIKASKPTCTFCLYVDSTLDTIENDRSSRQHEKKVATR